MDLIATRNIYPPLNLPFRHNYLCGQIYPPLIDGFEIYRTRNYELRNSDIILVTYPKSGTLWVQQMLKLLLEGGGINKECRVVSQNSLDKAVPWIEKMNREEFNALPSPRVLTTHETYNAVAWQPGTCAKYIYLSRNPKDVAVSYYHHISALRPYEYKEGIESFLNNFKTGKVPYGSWFTHNLDWHENLNSLDVFYIDYESLHVNFEKTLLKLNEFLGLKGLSNKDIESIKERSSFDQMRQDSNTNMSKIYHRRKPNSVEFLRRGKVGDWEEHISENDANEIDNITASYFKNTTKRFIDAL